MKLLVECRFTIPVEVPDGPDYDAHFDIEENHCPGTGIVGSALDAHIKAHDAASTCWACALGGECKIIIPGWLCRECAAHCEVLTKVGPDASMICPVCGKRIKRYEGAMPSATWHAAMNALGRGTGTG